MILYPGSVRTERVKHLRLCILFRSESVRALWTCLRRSASDFSFRRVKNRSSTTRAAVQLAFSSVNFPVKSLFTLQRRRSLLPGRRLSSAEHVRMVFFSLSLSLFFPKLSTCLFYGGKWLMHEPRCLLICGVSWFTLNEINKWRLVPWARIHSAYSVLEPLSVQVKPGI